MEYGRALTIEEIRAFRLWASKKTGKYNYIDPERCAFALWLKSQGYTGVSVGPCSASFFDEHGNYQLIDLDEKYGVGDAVHGDGDNSYRGLERRLYDILRENDVP